ncbi:MAG: aldo/keto reductase [Pseudomonadota bacterium]|nr:aldo/keto reductase [Pseudomonadota bacterium]
MMEYTTLGRTGLNVSVAGLGCGGNSKIGQGKGKSRDESVRLVRRALDLGVNFLDTAEAYGTESVVGEAIRSVPRDRVVVSTKFHAGDVSRDRLSHAVDSSLRELGTDYIDVFHLHGVKPAEYDHAIAELVPVLLRARDAGKIRFLGITETSPNDHGHTMLQRAVNDGCWDVMMLGFNMMHQVARSAVLPRTVECGIGTLMMFVVRNIFSVPGRLHATIKDLAAAGKVPYRLGDTDDPLGFLVYEGGADSVIDAAYRYVRHEPGVDVVLFGTSRIGHLESNIESILKAPLPQKDTAMLAELFGHLRGVGLDLPGPT